MAWSPETNTHFLATGANDNLVHVWDDRNVSAPIHTFSDHQAAIKGRLISEGNFRPSNLPKGELFYKDFCPGQINKIKALIL